MTAGPGVNRVSVAQRAGAVLDGRALAHELMDNVYARVGNMHGAPGIATLLVGEAQEAVIYQRRINAGAREIGMASRAERLPGDATFGQVVGKLAELDADPRISGILVLRPLPPHLPENRVLRAIPAHKDVEAQHPENAGLLALGMPRFIPSTPAAAFLMLDRYMTTRAPDLASAYDGLDLVIVGRSTNVGKPAAILGLQRNATVVSCHKHTADAGRLAEHTRLADVLIVAAGVPRLISGDMLRRGAIVIDVGINVVRGPDGRTKLVGDVDFDSARQVAGAISPVPGGVGPITDAWVLHNAVLAAERASPGRAVVDGSALLTAAAS